MKSKTQTSTPTEKKIELTTSYLRAAIQPETIDEKNRRVKVRLSTGATVTRFPFFGEPYSEKLSLDPEHVDLNRFQHGVPLLDAHNSGRILDQIGILEEPTLGADYLDAWATFSDRSDVEPIWNDVRKKIIRNLSIGYATRQYRDITEPEDKIPTYLAINWELMEGSMVPVPADAGATVRKNDKTTHECRIFPKETKENPMSLKAQARAASTQEDPKDEKTNPSDPAPASQPEEKEPEKTPEGTGDAVAAERSRAAEVIGLCEKHGMDSAFSTRMVKEGKSVASVSQAILKEMEARSDTGGNIRSQISVGRDLKVEGRRDGMMNAIMLRATPSIVVPEKQKEAADQYRGFSLIDMARECIEAAGGRSRGLSRREIAVAAMNLDRTVQSRSGMQSTSDFPEILANTIGRQLRKAYELAPRTFVPWCRRSTAPDFKEQARVQLSEISQFQAVNQGGEYKSVFFGEGAEKYSLAKYGGIILFTWESLMNDDLDAFSRAPQALAEEAAATEADIVYAILTGTSTMADGIALFHTSHANYTSSGTAISVDALGIARAQMKKQTGKKGRVLNLSPKFLIVGPDKEAQANQFTSVLYVASESGKINPSFNTSLQPIVDARISGNTWFTAADPARIDTIEYAHLEGEEGLFTETQMGFEVDGIKIKGRLVFGAKAIDHRGMTKNAGA